MSRILIIDDHDEFRRMLNRMLTQEGYDVVEASNGEEGIRHYREGQIDLVITDVFMPVMEGTETVIKLKEMDPDVKIIVVSGGGSRNHVEFLYQMKDFGAKKTLEKPFHPPELLAAVVELLSAE
jgi:CheY-like chemotaxis protein